MSGENLKDSFSKFVKPETKLLKTLELRDLHKELTNYLYKSRTKEEFTIGFIYKYLIEDLLKNLSEDDYVENSKAKEVIRKICSSISYYIRHENDRKGWLEKLFDVSEEYQKIPFSRLIGSEIFVKGPNEEEVKLFVADSGEDKIFAGEDLDYEIFPLLDRNLTDPDFSKPICDWYLKTISKLKEEDEINALCLIEKEFSVVGGLAMLSQLVYELELPVTIYRAAYWDKDAKVSGAKLTPDSKTAIIFDVVYSGRMLLEVAQFLKEYFYAETKAAVVFFNFEKGDANLKREDIKLRSYLKFSDVEEQIKDKLPLVKKFREIKDNIVFKHNYEESEKEIKKVINKYILK